MTHQITITLKSGVQLLLLCEHITVGYAGGKVRSLSVEGRENMKCLFIDMDEIAAITQQLETTT